MDNVSFSNTTATSVHNISRALILHPIAAAVSLLAFLTALISHRIGFLFSSLIGGVATLITLIALILDIVNFSVSSDFRKIAGVVLGDGDWSGSLTSHLLFITGRSSTTT